MRETETEAGTVDKMVQKLSAIMHEIRERD